MIHLGTATCTYGSEVGSPPARIWRFRSLNTERFFGTFFCLHGAAHKARCVLCDAGDDRFNDCRRD